MDLNVILLFDRFLSVVNIEAQSGLLERTQEARNLYAVQPDLAWRWLYLRDSLIALRQQMQDFPNDNSDCCAKILDFVYSNGLGKSTLADAIGMSLWELVPASDCSIPCRGISQFPQVWPPLETDVASPGACNLFLFGTKL